MASLSISDTIDWLLQQGLEGISEVSLVAGFCERLNELGFDIERAAVGSSILHPVHSARAFIWRAGRGCWQEDYGDEPSEDARESWEKSPFRHVLEHKMVGASFLAQNAGKRSISLDLKNTGGKAVFERLVKSADVVVENFRSGVMQRLGFGYVKLKATQPSLKMPPPILGQDTDLVLKELGNSEAEIEDMRTNCVI